MSLHRSSILLTFLILCAPLYAHSHETASPHRVDLSLDLYSDIFCVNAPGESLHGTAQTWADFTASAPLGQFSPKLARLRVFSSFHINGSWNSGLDNAVQALSNLQARPGLRLAELWVEDTINPRVLVRVGKIDANRDFAYIENAALLLNGSNAYNLTFFTLPNYNDARPGVELLMQPRRLHLNLAAFSPISGTGVLFVEEIGKNWTASGHAGRFAAGAWQQTGRLLTLENKPDSGATGGYVLGEQNLWRRLTARDAEQSLTVHFQVGAAPARFSTFSQQLETGFLFSAPLHRRPMDAAGFALSRGHFSRAYPSRNETALETFYRIQLSPQFAVTPDLQYFLHPGASSRGLVAFGARFALSLKSSSE